VSLLRAAFCACLHRASAAIQQGQLIARRDGKGFGKSIASPDACWMLFRGQMGRDSGAGPKNAILDAPLAFLARLSSLAVDQYRLASAPAIAETQPRAAVARGNMRPPSWPPEGGFLKPTPRP
jgi:hypothetical protein